MLFTLENTPVSHDGELYDIHWYLLLRFSRYRCIKLLRVFSQEIRTLLPAFMVYNSCGYGNGWFKVLILVGARDFFSSPAMPRQALGQSLHFGRYRVSFLVVKHSGCEVNHPPPSSAKVKNERSYTPSEPMFLYGMDNETVRVWEWHSVFGPFKQW